MRSHIRVNRMLATGLATTAALVVGSTGVATADEPGLDSTEQIIEAVTGSAPEVLTGETAIGEVLTVSAAAEVDTTYVVETEGGATSVVASIENPDVTTVSFDLDIDDGYAVYLTGDGGGMVVDEATLADLQKAGEGAPSGTPVDVTVAITATLEAPWAVDATGRELPTRYELDGDVLVQHVDTAGAVFPVAADPSWGLGWQYITPVYYVHYNRSETHSISTYRVDYLSSARWLCDFLPGWAVSLCRTLVSNRASDLVGTAKTAWNSGKCLSYWQGYGSGVSVFFYDAYVRSC